MLLIEIYLDKISNGNIKKNTYLNYLFPMIAIHTTLLEEWAWTYKKIIIYKTF